MGSKQLFLAVLFASSIPTGHALAQSGPDRDELRATMRVLAPEASDPEPIFRKIPPPKSKKPGVDDDSPAKDLASPGGDAGHEDSGSAGDPGPLCARARPVGTLDAISTARKSCLLPMQWHPFGVELASASELR